MSVVRWSEPPRPSFLCSYCALHLDPLTVVWVTAPARPLALHADCAEVMGRGLLADVEDARRLAVAS